MQPEPCCVPNCYRRAKSTLPFCERCWSSATDEERVGVQVAMHAPFYPRWFSGAEQGDLAIDDPGIAAGGLRPAFAHGFLSVEYVDHAGKREWAVHAGAYLQAYEARTTREAVAAAISNRRRVA
jgi:hypothetical protein